MGQMKVLVPVDGSDCSFRALEFAIDMAECFGADIHVVHFSDAETEATESILDRAQEMFDERSVDDDPELLLGDSDVRRADAVGDAILEYVADESYDHVVMGHHSDGWLGKAITGSAAEKVLHAEAVPVTIVP